MRIAHATFASLLVVFAAVGPWLLDAGAALSTAFLALAVVVLVAGSGKRRTGSEPRDLTLPIWRIVIWTLALSTVVILLAVAGLSPVALGLAGVAAAVVVALIETRRLRNARHL